MINRSLRLPKNNSFFLFGPRGTGKTHLLREFLKNKSCLYIDLLDPERNQTLSLRPKALEDEILGLDPDTRWVVIDEVQKIPALLDIVHRQIESKDICFALTGSSARKLKTAGANMLAGRAFLTYLFPFTSMELGNSFSLSDALRWGTLPKIYSLKTEEEKRDYLRSYTHVYLQEEITQEQVVRKLDPFRRFLVVAAQLSGQIINFSKVGRDVGVSVPTVQSYFQILEDTRIGFLLDPFHESVRKRQRENPKFYLFDTGVQRALENTLALDLLPSTYAYGVAFEHFIINEIFRLSSYAKHDDRFSYLRTKDEVEIDLVIERPGRKKALVEIKSTEFVRPEDIHSFQKLGSDIPRSDMYCFSRDPHPKMINGVHCLPWQKGLTELGF
jgi:predicted AAA+ superfamily ATPase